MTLDELLARESIRHTMAKYTFAGDRLRAAEFVATFTDDGILESENVSEQDAFRYQGHPEIGAWLERWTRPSTAASAAPRARFVRHHLATSLIEILGPDVAKARTYWTAYTDIGQDHCGYYVDDFRRHNGQWLIAHRRVRLDWRAAESLFVTVISDSR